jgi:hypothetical protein
MKRKLITTLSMGIGWVTGITIMMVLMPLTYAGGSEMVLMDGMGNSLMFGIPGFLLFIIAIILATKSDKREKVFSGNF